MQDYLVLNLVQKDELNWVELLIQSINYNNINQDSINKFIIFTQLNKNKNKNYTLLN